MVRLLVALLAIKALLLAALLSFWPVHLGPEEAQYWLWSRELDWGYYSKPPGIAWEIWLGSKLFGSTELGVRAGALFLSFLLPLAVFRLAKACGLEERPAFWSSLALAFCPLGILSSILATTDAGYVLFWTLASASLAQALKEEEAPNYLVIGLLVACGALFKWPIYLFWLLALALCPARGLFLGFALSLLGLVPSLVWNAQRGWPTFLHVAATVGGGHGQAAAGNFWEFFGAQTALFSPALFALLFPAWTWGVKQQGPLRLFCFGSAALFLPYQLLALFQKMQGNWCVFLYPFASVLVTAYLFHRFRRPRFWMLLFLALPLAAAALLIALPFLSSFPLKNYPLKECVGWDKLAGHLKSAGYDPEKEVLIADAYQTASLLSFYSEGQKRAYFLNLTNRRPNQFSFWPGLQPGASGLFARVGRSEEMERLKEFYRPLLRAHFASVEPLGVFPLFEGGEKELLLFRCLEKKAPAPPDFSCP